MHNRSRRAATGALILLSLALPASAAAAPVTVHVRVEGATETIFDGDVVTDAHHTTTPSDGTARPCDGTNSGGSPIPTAIGALDDASKAGGFGWDAEWDDGFGDYYPFLKIGDDPIDPSSHYLAFYLNWVYADLGGCSQGVKQGDEVLFAHSSFSMSKVLRLRGPATATTGQPVRVSVEEFDGFKGSPAAGATVAGRATGSDGSATMSFAQKGIYRLRADRSDAVRSNAIVLCVDPPGALPCSSTDTVGPSISAATPGGSLGPSGSGARLASARGKSRTMLITWAGDDGQGAGVAHYSVEVMEVGDGEWRSLLDKAPVNGVHFRGDAGSAYRFRITATDRALNETKLETDTLVVPVDDRNRRLWRFSKRGWERERSGDAWGKTVMRADRAGASARFAFEGSSVALVGRKLRRGGRLRVTLDGKSRVLSVRGRSGPRTVLWTSAALDEGRHTLRLRTLGGGPVELDAIAPAP